MFESMLEGLGLSINEAKAYTALLSHGPQSGSELAYKAGIPRSKVYSVIKRLAKKELVNIINNKPLVIDALPPEYAFEKFVRYHQRLADDIREIIKKSEMLKSNRVINKSYRVVNRNEYISDLIINARHIILLMIDAYNTDLLKQYKSELIIAARKGIDVKILSNTHSIIDGVELKVCDVIINILIIDYQVILFNDVDRYYIFDDEEFMKMYLMIFNKEWNKQRISEIPSS